MSKCLQSPPAENVALVRMHEHPGTGERATGCLARRRSRSKTPRLDLIARLRAEIAAGTYVDDEKLSAAINDLLLSL